MKRIALSILFILTACHHRTPPTVWSPPPRAYCFPVESVRVIHGQARYPNLVCYPGNYIHSLRDHPNACLRQISVPVHTLRELAEAPEGEELRRRNPNFLYNVLLQYFTVETCPDGLTIVGGFSQD